MVYRIDTYPQPIYQINATEQPQTFPWIPDGAGLFIDFNNNRAYKNDSVITSVDAVNLTRAGSALMLGPDGYQSFAAGELARIDGIGAQVAPARTNLIANPRGEGGVVGTSLPSGWGIETARGLSVDYLGNGTELGLTYTTLRIHGTTTEASGFQFRFSSVVAVGMGSTHTGSFGLKQVDGSSANITGIRVLERQNSGAFPDSSSYFVSPYTNYQRLSATHTNASDSTNGLTLLRIEHSGVGSVIDITVRIYAPQTEVGSYASPPMLPPPGTIAAVSRPGDILSASVPDGGRAFVFEFDLLEPLVPNDGRFRQFLSWNAGSANNLWSVYSYANNGSLLISQRSGGAASGSEPSINSGLSVGRNIIYGALASGYRRVGIAGAAESVVASDGLAPVGITQLGVGGTGYSTGNNTFIHAHRFTERPLTDFATPADAFAWAKSIAQGWA